MEFLCCRLPPSDAFDRSLFHARIATPWKNGGLGSFNLEGWRFSNIFRIEIGATLFRFPHTKVLKFSIAFLQSSQHTQGMSCLMSISMTECDVLNLVIAMGFALTNLARLSSLKSLNRRRRFNEMGLKSWVDCENAKGRFPVRFN